MVTNIQTYLHTYVQTYQKHVNLGWSGHFEYWPKIQIIPYFRGRPIQSSQSAWVSHFFSVFSSPFSVSFPAEGGDGGENLG